jgi:ribosomal protein S18 acetylase RimI-like enzyme
MEFTIRRAQTRDEPFLWQMLFFAAHMDEDGAVSPEPAKTNPDLAPYVRDWSHDRGDLGFLAVTQPTDRNIGAAWLRLMPPESPIYRFVDSRVPELAIAIAPDCLGIGVGSALLNQLLAAAKERYPAIALSVRSGNPARRLYERFGFTVIAQIANRVGGDSFVMKADLR